MQYDANRHVKNKVKITTKTEEKTTPQRCNVTTKRHKDTKRSYKKPQRDRKLLQTKRHQSLLCFYKHVSVSESKGSESV